LPERVPAADIDHGGSMSQRYSGIRLLEGSTDILLIAPHGPVVDNRPRNNENTGIMVEQIRKRLSCFAIINDAYLKPDVNNEQSLENKRLDFNKTRQALHLGAITGHMTLRAGLALKRTTDHHDAGIDLLNVFITQF